MSKFNRCDGCKKELESSVMRNNHITGNLKIEYYLDRSSAYLELCSDCTGKALAVLGVVLEPKS